MRHVISVVLGFALLAGPHSARGETVDVQVREVQGTVDSIHLTWDGRRPVSTQMPVQETPSTTVDFREMLKDLRIRNRKSLLELKRDVDAMNVALEAGSVGADETRLLLADIRMRRIDARVSLNLMGYMNRVAQDEDLSGLWGDPVRLMTPAPATPNVLVVNRTRGQMAADVLDADTIRVVYIPAFSGFEKEAKPDRNALENVANVQADVSLHSASAVAAAVEGLDKAHGGGIAGAITVVSVSDPTGMHAPPGATAEDPPARGVLVFPSAMVPRPERLLLDRAEPVAIRDMEGVQVVHLVNSDKLVERLSASPGRATAGFERTTGFEGHWSQRGVPPVPPMRKPGSSGTGDARRAAPPAALVTDPRGPAAFNQGVGLLAAGKFDEAKQRFEDAISEDDGYAPSYVGLGRVYLERGAGDDAEYYLKKALKRSPGSPSALKALSDVAMRGEDWGDQKKWTGQILDRDPNNPEALYRRAIAYRESGKHKGTVARWLDWRRSDRHFRQLLDTAPQYRDALYQYAVLRRYDKAFVKAVRLGESQVRIKPDEFIHRRRLRRLYLYLLDNTDPKDALKWLRRHGTEYAQYFEGEALRLAGRTARADTVLRSWLSSDPSLSVIPAYLSLARIAYGSEDVETGEGHYNKAVESIRDSLDAQLMYEDVKYVVTVEEMDAFSRLEKPEAYREFFRKLWVSRDPTPAVSPNVRLAEHYRRILYAERYYIYDGFRTWFYDPDQGDNIPYPTTVELNDRFNDPGLIYIRHGRPSDTQKFSMAEVWHYWKTDAFQKMVFNFVATPSSMGSNWRLVESLSGSGNYGRRLRWENEKLRREVRKSVETGLQTDRHTLDDDVDDLDYESYLAYFRGDGGRGDVELYYGMPFKALKKDFRQLPDTAAIYEYGLALHDMQWNRYENLTGYVRKSHVERSRYKDRSFGVLRFSADPDSGHAAFFLRPSRDNLLGGWKQDLRIPEFSETNLEMSSVVPAHVIRAGVEGSHGFNLRGVQAVPNPSLRFSRRDPVYIYFELYNLTPDERGTTSFEVSYGLTRLKRQGIRRLLRIFGSGEKPATTVTVERIGDSPDTRESLALDLNKAGSGEFLLKVKVRDIHAGTEREQSVELVLE
ncbi:MAG: tetratricopeptide repeat protein [Gemmatimonadota bacterium]|nr:tetratricopeptide repeat protein [Gemmatimonadota bacterium]